MTLRSLCGLLLFGLCLLSAGCGSSPNTRFYTLSPVRPAEAVPVMAGPVVQIQAVHVPASLDRQELVTRRSAARMDVHDFEHWTAPLSELIRDVLSQDLAARASPGMVLPPQAPVPPNARGIVVDIEQFQPGPDGRVQLRASWSLTGNGPPIEGGSLQRSGQAAADGADAQVASMNRLLGQLADAIARWLPTAVP